MTERVRFGIPVDPSADPAQLDPMELQELRELLSARQQSRRELAFVEQRIQLLLVNARDRRGLQGVAHVDPATGRFVVPSTSETGA